MESNKICKDSKALRQCASYPYCEGCNNYIGPANKSGERADNKTELKTPFGERLEKLINSLGLENASNTPDYLLAKFIDKVFWAVGDLIWERDKWYGVKQEPGKMSTDELLEKLPKKIGNHYENGCYLITDEGDDIQYLNLHNDGKDWCASYGEEGEFLCMNPNATEPPYDNAFAYGSTPQEALQGLYDWCMNHGFIKE